MQALEYYYLLGIGIAFIGIEAIFFSFFIMWIGIGFVLVGVVSLFIVFDSAWVQIALAFSIGLVLVILFRKKMMQEFSTIKVTPEEQIHKEGVGTIQDGSIKMDGTFWQSDDDLSIYKDGDKVEVSDIVNNKAKIVKKD